MRVGVQAAKPAPPTGRHKLIFLKKNLRGNIRKTVREVYLRDFVSCGIAECAICAAQARKEGWNTAADGDRALSAPLSISADGANASPVDVLIVDVDVAKNQLDFLTDEPCVDNCVLLATVINELRRGPNVQAAHRLRSQIDHTDVAARKRAIKLATIRQDDNKANDDDDDDKSNDDETEINIKSTDAGAAEGEDIIMVDDDDDDDDVDNVNGNNNGLHKIARNREASKWQPPQQDCNVGTGTRTVGSNRGSGGRRFFVFQNEFCAATATNRMAGETAQDRSARAVRKAAAWYQEHLKQIPFSSPQLSATIAKSKSSPTDSRQAGGSWAGRLESSSSSSHNPVDPGASLSSSGVECADVSSSSSSSSRARGGRVLLIVNSQNAKSQALAEGISCMTIYEFVESVRDKFPECGDKLNYDQARRDAEQDDDENDGDDEDSGIDEQKRHTGDVLMARVTRSDNKQAAIYDKHLSVAEIAKGLREGTLYEGVIAMRSDTCLEAIVRCRQSRRQTLSTSSSSSLSEIFVGGRTNINRAIDGDVVAVQVVVGEGAGDADKFWHPETLLDEEDDDDEDGDEEGADHNGDNNDSSGRHDVEKDQKCRKRKSNDEEMKSNRGQQQDRTRISDMQKGKVVGIIRRNWREYGGSLRPLEQDSLSGRSSFVKTERIFIPVDPRVPFIRIKTRHSAELENKRLAVAIDGWSRTSKLPTGHWTHILGDLGDRKTETALILKEQGVVTRNFPLSVIKCLPPADWSIPESEVAKRLDLRKKVLVCSVDPPGCKDIDDALSVETLPNGNYRVGVHIADVTHFVRPATAVDKEAAERCTTVYLATERTDMFPGLLTTDLCSLVGNRDRLAFSVLWEMSSEAEIVSFEFAKVVICSSAALSYAEAQQRIDDSNDTSPLTANLRILMALSKKIRERREAGGALSLASSEVTFELDKQTHDPTDVTSYELRDTNKMIEDYMCLANTTVAEFILSKFPTVSVLRRHPEPRAAHLEKLQSLLASKGFKNFSFGDSKELARSLDATTVASDPYFNKLLRMMTTRCMNQAVYFCTGETSAEDYHHYGLGLRLYTHFTSPIRRYADVLVHRLLAAALGLEALPDLLLKKSEIVEQCHKMNQRTRAAQVASRESVKFESHQFFKKTGPKFADAVITALRGNGIQVLVPKYGVESLIKFEKSNFEFDQENMVLSSKLDASLSLAVFDWIRVHITADDQHFRNSVTFEFVRKLPKAVKSCK